MLILLVYYFGLLQVHCLETVEDGSPATMPNDESQSTVSSTPSFPYPDTKQIITPLFGSLNDGIGWYSKLNYASPLSGITQKVNDLINSNTLIQDTMASHLKNTDISKFSPRNLQIISDMFSMLEPNYMYNKMLSEKQIHQDSYVAAYRDLEDAMNILSDEQSQNNSDIVQRTNERLFNAKDHILSAVQHLQDSCPLCRALKHAVSDADNTELLPFITSASLGILKSLHHIQQ